MVKFRKMLINDKGFTLIELLVVIAVLGILAAIAIPRLTGVTQKARESSLESSGSSIRSSVEMYLSETGQIPEVDSDQLVVPGTTDAIEYSVNIDSDDYSLVRDNASTSNNTYQFTLTHDSSGDYVTITQNGVNYSTSP